METGPRPGDGDAWYGRIPGGQEDDGEPWAVGEPHGTKKQDEGSSIGDRACAEVDAQGPVPSVMEESKRIGYSKWQKAEAEERKSPVRRVTLPPLTYEGKKKKGEKNKPVAFMLKKSPFPLETSSSQGKTRSFTQRKSALKEAELAEALEEIKMTTRVKAIAQTINQNQLDTARAELQKMEKTMEKNLGKLQQQLDEVTSKVQALQDELGVLRTYIDKHYPEQAVQIVLLQHSIQNMKKQQQVTGPLLPCNIARRKERAGEEGAQGLPCLTLLLSLCAASCCSQEEIDKTEEMGKAMLEKLEEKRAEQEALLQKVMEEKLLHQDGLKQVVINNHILQCEILSGSWGRTSAVIKDLEEEIGELKGSIQTLCQRARDPRELIFADVLLRRPKCTPDTEVVLSTPTEEMPLIDTTRSGAAGLQ
ncbi:LOW QUALITY PROTEIN: uncharacterized protein C20orf96 homolog [Podargus strigoides]